MAELGATMSKPALPQEIKLFMYSLLQGLPKLPQQQQSTSDLETQPGTSGPPSLNPLEYEMITSWIPSQQ
jgi:hypothetical protein